MCCRFPESDSFLRPYFTAEEIRQALDGGIDPSHFPTRDGCQISVVPHPRGEGYLCPAFDPLTSHCRIYESRPLDCQIYPLAVMWSADRSEVLLGWDSKCPYLQSGEGREASGKGSDGLSSSPSPLASSHVPDAYADRIAALLERDDMIDTLAQNRQMIGRFQEDVVVLRPLVGLTARLRRETLGGRGRAGSGLSPQSATHSPEWTSHALPLTSLTLADRPRVDHALASSTWMGDM
ncbi:MAG: YkgJ family cysteine cluster protein, partial [Nitrospiraceae bacterium]